MRILDKQSILIMTLRKVVRKDLGKGGNAFYQEFSSS